VSGCKDMRLRKLVETAVAPERIWKWGHTNFLSPPIFWLYKYN